MRRVARNGFIAGLLLTALPAAATDCIILLHGLARTAGSMEKMADAFQERGFSVANIDYPSTRHTVEMLAPMAVEAGIAACPSDRRLNFVTHSMGGILVRYYLQNNTLRRLGRTVMLAPPNQGSEVVDNYRDVPGFQAWNGPAGMQLGTGPQGIPARLGPVRFELGVIAGTRTFNPILSQSLPNPDDGKVSVANTRVEGMTDFISLPYTHTFMMQAPAVIEQAIAFIEHGRFNPPETGDEATD